MLAMKYGYFMKASKGFMKHFSGTLLNISDAHARPRSFTGPHFPAFQMINPPMNCLSVLDHFVGLTRLGVMIVFGPNAGVY